MNLSENIPIIGGGIADLSGAPSFENKQIPYTIHEKSDSISSYDNIGLGISNNIFPILKKWNIFEETKTIGTEIKNLYFVNKNLRVINDFLLPKPDLSANRKKLFQLLISKINPTSIVLNSEKKTRYFLEKKIVISADGNNSLLRKEKYSNLLLRNSKQILWRGISNIKLVKKYENAYHNFIGNNLRFATIHSGKDSYSWHMIKVHEEYEMMPTNQEYLKSLFKNYYPIVQEVIDATPSIYFSELKDVAPYQRKYLNWHHKNALLIGDAIHPTTPKMANGAYLAIEDAYLLSQLIKNEDTAEEIFIKFKKIRATKVDSIVFQSWCFGQLLHQKNKIICSLVNMEIAITPKVLFNYIYSKVLLEVKVS